MPRLFVIALALCTASAVPVLSEEKEKSSAADPRPASVTITKIDAKTGEITVKYADDKGKTQEKTFKLTTDVRLLDETGRVVKIDVFESGHNAFVVESEGALREIRRVPDRGQARQLSDAVRTLIELTECEECCAADLQKIYDVLRKLDTGKNGKIDASALKTEANNILTERVKDTFDRLDVAKSGKITKEQSRGLIKEHFEKIDANKDGFIAFEELLTAAKERREQQAADAKNASNDGKEKN